MSDLIERLEHESEHIGNRQPAREAMREAVEQLGRAHQEINNMTTAPFGDKRTPRQVLIDAVGRSDEYEIAIVISLDKDGFVETGWSDGSSLKRIGMLETSKARVCESQQTPEG